MSNETKMFSLCVFAILRRNHISAASFGSAALWFVEESVVSGDQFIANDMRHAIVTVHDAVIHRLAVK